MSKLARRLMGLCFFTLILTIFPLPNVFSFVKPPWVLLLILYVQFYLPFYFRVFFILILGFAMDALMATVLGEHVFAFSLITWLASTKARRFYFFPTSQQMAFIGFFSLLYQLNVALIDAFLGYQPNIGSIFGGSLLSTLLWPWMRLGGEEFLLSIPKKIPKHGMIG